MSRRRDGHACWPTSAAYGAIAADCGAGPAGVTAAGDRIVVIHSVPAKLPWSSEPQEARRDGGWREQAEAAGVLDRLGGTVRAELGEEVAYMRPDRVHRQGQLAGDLRSRQVGRQVTQHTDLGLAERIYQAEGVC